MKYGTPYMATLSTFEHFALGKNYFLKYRIREIFYFR
jgi:hypothetical protein